MASTCVLRDDRAEVGERAEERQASGSSPSSSGPSATAPTRSKPRGGRQGSRARGGSRRGRGRRRRCAAAAPGDAAADDLVPGDSEQPRAAGRRSQRPQGHVHPGDLEQHRDGKEQERRGKHHAHGAHGEGAGELAAIPAATLNAAKPTRAHADGDGDRGARQAARHPGGGGDGGETRIAQMRGGPATPTNRHSGNDGGGRSGRWTRRRLTWGASTGSGVPSRAVSAAAIGAITRFRRGARTSDGPVEKNQRHTTALSGGVNRKVRPCSLDPPVGGLDHRTGSSQEPVINPCKHPLSSRTLRDCGSVVTIP